MIRPVSKAGPKDTQRGRAVNYPPWPALRHRSPGSSSIGMLGPRMECPGSPSAAREMTGKLCFAVKRKHLLAPVVGRRFLGGDVGRPVAHHLGDAALNWQRATSSNFPFRKGLLLFEHVERRKGKRGGGTSLRLSVPA
jgi:hypothetical protein